MRTFRPFFRSLKARPVTGKVRQAAALIGTNVPARAGVKNGPVSQNGSKISYFQQLLSPFPVLLVSVERDGSEVKSHLWQEPRIDLCHLTKNPEIRLAPMD